MDRRYMDHDPAKPAGAATVEPRDRMVELKTQAVLGWVWTLIAEPGGRWSLRHLDWRTDELSEPAHISPALPDIDAAMRWAETHASVWRWAGRDDRAVDQAYTLFRLVLDNAR